MKIIIAAIVSLVCLQATAEEKTCAVKGMECTGCVDMVKDKVCTENFSTCDVTVTDKKNKVGQIHIVTKDATAKVDEKALSTAIKDTTYTVEKCAAGAPKKKI